MNNIFDQFDEEETSVSENIFDQFDQDQPDAVPNQEQLDAISTQMYSGMTFSEAREKYNQLLESKQVKAPPLGIGYAVFEDEKTKRREYIPKPSPKLFGKDGILANTTDALKKVVTGDFKGASEAYDDTKATVSGFDKVATGLGESFGAAVETGAAVAEKAGAEGALDAVNPLVNQIDTGDSFTDAILTDAVPVAASALGVGGVMNSAVKGYPLILRALATAIPAEAAASLGVSTEEGTMLVGDTAAIPIDAFSKGIVDLGDEKADKILEQRLNTFGEGLMLTSFISGIAPVGVKAAELGGKFALFPIYAALVGGTTMERRVYERIANQLAQIDEGASPQQIMEVRRNVAETIRANKDVIIPMFENMEKDQKITVDTISALLRGSDDPKVRATAGSLLQGQLQRGGKAPATIAAVEEPQAILQAEMEDYLRQVGGETASDQTATMGQAADTLAEQGRRFVDEGEDAVITAQGNYEEAADAVVQGFKQDIEFGQQIEKLEDLVGTEIVVDQTTSFEAVRKGLETAYEEMTSQKNALYDAIPSGTTFDIEGFGDALKQATENANMFSDAGSRLLGKRLISTIRKAYKAAEEIPTVDEFGNISEVPSIDDVIEEIAASGVDFKVLYNDIRPKISQLVDEAFENREKEVGYKLIKIKNAIDDQVSWIANNTDDVGEEAAEAAKEAYRYFSDEYVPNWRSGGRMQEFGDLYDPVVVRGTQQDAYTEGSFEIVKDVISGNNPDKVANMARALSEATNPTVMADYMIADVLSGFAAEIRKNGTSSGNLSSISEKIRVYAESLNTAFPEQAARVNEFIRSVNLAANNKLELENVLKMVGETSEATKNAVKASELGVFFRGSLGKEFDTTLHPYNAFKKIFMDTKDGLGKLTDIKTRVANLPEADRIVVQDGMEAAYMRMLADKVNAAKMESGGSQSLKVASVEGILQEKDQILEMGEILFAEKPEFLNGLKDLLVISRMIGKSKGASPVSAFSPTVFNAEATKATNRLITAFIGPLSRPGAKARALAGGVFDALDPTRRAEIMLDNIFANPDKYLELSRKYDIDPMNPEVKENLITGLTTGFIKGVTSYMSENNNIEQQMMNLLPQ